MVIKKMMIIYLIGTLVLSAFVGIETFNIEGKEGSFGGGSGTMTDPYLIEDIWDLQAMSNKLSAYYSLANNIDASSTTDWNSGSGFIPIGTYENRFVGSFDGRGYEITGLYINRPSTYYVGLFGAIGANSYISNISLVNMDITGYYDVGGLIGHLYWSSRLFNSSSEGNVIGTGSVGGLVGDNSGSISNSFFIGNITGTVGVGGLVGGNRGEIDNSYAAGNITGTSNVGGLVGVSSYGSESNSHYNIDTVFINGGHHVTIGGLFDSQYKDWFSKGKVLNIIDYDITLVPSGNYYDISNVQGLRDILGFTDNLGYKFRLVSDIDLSTNQGLYIPYFTAAEFDGNNHSISNLWINQPFAHALGMFGSNINGLINNLSLLDVEIIGGDSVGGLVGWNYGGSVFNSSCNGNVEGNYSIGGLIGMDYGGTFTDSHSAVNVDGNNIVGGLVGFLRESSVSSSYTTGKINGNYSVGGLVGGSDTRCSISNCYTTGKVNGKNYVGGIIGYSSKLCKVSYSHTTGDVFGTADRIGGIAGSIGDGSVSNSSSEGNIEGNDFVGGLVGVYFEDFIHSFSISDSVSTGKVEGNHCVGGLVGGNGGRIKDSYSTGEINGNESIGGLVGYNYGLISASYTNGNVNGNKDIGGFVGWNCDKNIIDSYATGNVNGGLNVGGFVGRINQGSVSNSYSIGKVEGDNYIGGFVGRNEGGSVSNSFWDIAASSTISSDGGTGKNTFEMKTIYTFIWAGWDFDNVWFIVEKITYPLFRRQDLLSPIADAGPNQTVEEDTMMNFNGSSSSDNFGIARYIWTFNDSIGNITLKGIAPTHIFNTPGKYTIVLNVTDGVDLWDMDEMTITVRDITLPIANSGLDQIVNEDSLVFFNGNLSFDNIGIVNYTWTFFDLNKEVILYGALQSYFFTIPGVYIVTLKVIDDEGLNSTDFMIVTVRDITPPTADAGPDLIVDEDTMMVFNGDKSTDNTGIINYNWIFNDGINDILLNGTNPNYIFYIPGVYLVTLNVSDSVNLWDIDMINVTVKDISPPVSDAGPDRIIDEDIFIIFNGGKSTDNVGIVDYTWKFNDGISNITLFGITPTYRFTKPGMYIITLTVSDAVGLYNTDTNIVRVNDITPPVANAGLDQIVTSGSNVILNGSGSYDNGGIISYVWTFICYEVKQTHEGEIINIRFDEIGSFEVILTVVDLNDNHAEDTVIVTVMGKGLVYGRILDEDGKPVNRATVEIVASDGSTYKTTSIWNGSFSIEIPYGEFSWKIIKKGYRTINGNSSLEAFTNMELDLSQFPLIKESPKKTSPMLFLLPVVILILLITVILIIILRRKKKDETNTQDEQEKEVLEEETIVKEGTEIEEPNIEEVIPDEKVVEDVPEQNEEIAPIPFPEDDPHEMESFLKEVDEKK